MIAVTDADNSAASGSKNSAASGSKMTDPTRPADQGSRGRGGADFAPPP